MSQNLLKLQSLTIIIIFFFPISEIILGKYGKKINEIRNKSNLKHNTTTLHHHNDYFCSIAPELSDRIPMSQINPTQYLKNNFQNSMLLPTI